MTEATRRGTMTYDDLELARQYAAMAQLGFAISLQDARDAAKDEP